MNSWVAYRCKTKQAAISYVPEGSVDSVRRHGLLSGEALLKNPEALRLASVGRGQSEDELRASILEILKGWKPDSARGVNAMFAPPPPELQLNDQHPLRRFKPVPVSIDIDRLLKDMPTTRLHGQELLPYADYTKLWTKEQLEQDQDDPSLRHRDLSPEELASLRKMPPKDLWKAYSATSAGRMYAPDVPHLAIVTPEGRIDPKYLTFGKQAAVYHGSQIQGLETLEPRLSKVVGGEKALFATPDKDLALTYTAPWTDKDLEQGYINNQPYLRERAPGVFAKIFGGRSGSIYELADTGFTSDERLMPQERIKPEAAKVLREIRIRDVLKHLQRSKFDLQAFDKQADLRPEVELLPHQERVLEKILHEPGVLVAHGLGSGKTLASIAAAEAVGGRKQVIVPAALRTNYQKQLDQFVSRPKGYDIKSYDKARREGLQPADISIFDEAHRTGREDSALSDMPAQSQGKRVLLTGTPVRNVPSELTPILRAIAADRPIPRTADEFNRQFVGRKKLPRGIVQFLLGYPAAEVETLQNQPKLRKLLAGRVDWQDSKGEFPKVQEQEISVPMAPAQQMVYQGIMKSRPDLAWRIRRNLPPSKAQSQQMNAFLSAVRQVSNNPAAYDVSARHGVAGSPKLQRMYHELHRRAVKDPEFRGVVYSHYLDSGILPLADELAKANVPAGVFHGGMNDRERAQVVNDYNAGKLRVLLISGAGAEGLDLKGTNLVQLMEPHWNESKLQQVIGRAVRHRSHAHLPPEKQKVLVQRFYATPRPGILERIGLTNADTGADRYIRNRSLEKQKLIDEVLAVLKEIGTKPWQPPTTPAARSTSSSSAEPRSSPPKKRP